jgi:hypothetical protein
MSSFERWWCVFASITYNNNNSTCGVITISGAAGGGPYLGSMLGVRGDYPVPYSFQGASGVRKLQAGHPEFTL